jgi:hypothetical protein
MLKEKESVRHKIKEAYFTKKESAAFSETRTFGASIRISF